MTTGISLVRENTESMQPPRALWVSFPLGRPLGVPGDADFQHGVIQAALDLLTRPEGPVLENYPRDAPAMDAEAPACPVSFRKTHEQHTWESRLVAELNDLMPWYELGLKRRGGRTLVGISGAAPADDIAALGRLVDSGKFAEDVLWLKRAVEDLKTLYLEAITAQPGSYNTQALQQQLWHETQLGAALLTLFHRYQDSGNPQHPMIARLIAPREAIGSATGPGAEQMP